jgi:hypothetical protein
MKINSELGYKPVLFRINNWSKFWKGCQTCTNYEILKVKKTKCVVYRNAFWPKGKAKHPPKHPFNVRIWNRFKIKQALFLEDKKKTNNFFGNLPQDHKKSKWKKLY